MGVVDLQMAAPKAHKHLPPKSVRNQRLHNLQLRNQRRLALAVGSMIRRFKLRFVIVVKNLACLLKGRAEVGAATAVVAKMTVDPTAAKTDRAISRRTTMRTMRTMRTIPGRNRCIDGPIAPSERKAPSHRVRIAPNQQSKQAI
jgi:hypothetical protein